MEKLLPSHFHSRLEQLHLLNHTKTQLVLVQDGKWCLVLNTYLIDRLKYLQKRDLRKEIPFFVQ